MMTYGDVIQRILIFLTMCSMYIWWKEATRCKESVKFLDGQADLYKEELNRFTLLHAQYIDRLSDESFARDWGELELLRNYRLQKEKSDE